MRAVSPNSRPPSLSPWARRRYDRSRTTSLLLATSIVHDAQPRSGGDRPRRGTGAATAEDLAEDEREAAPQTAAAAPLPTRSESASAEEGRGERHRAEEERSGDEADLNRAEQLLRD